MTGTVAPHAARSTNASTTITAAISQKFLVRLNHHLSCDSLKSAKTNLSVDCLIPAKSFVVNNFQRYKNARSFAKILR